MPGGPWSGGGPWLRRTCPCQVGLFAPPESLAEREAVADLRARWHEMALREFVSSEDLDVRRCILPGLTLNPANHPADLRELVAEAVRIARAHPDEYIRHRVEHQV